MSIQIYCATGSPHFFDNPLECVKYRETNKQSQGSSDSRNYGVSVEHKYFFENRNTCVRVHDEKAGDVPCVSHEALPQRSLIMKCRARSWACGSYSFHCHRKLSESQESFPNNKGAQLIFLSHRMPFLTSVVVLQLFKPVKGLPPRVGKIGWLHVYCTFLYTWSK